MNNYCQYKTNAIFTDYSDQFDFNSNCFSISYAAMFDQAANNKIS